MIPDTAPDAPVSEQTEAPAASLPGGASPQPGPEHVEIDESVARPTLVGTARQWLHDYFVGDDPSFGLAIVPYCFISMLLFTRHPTKTNFIFDEQEALLANPYVRSIADVQPKFRWVDAFYRDFWGLGPDRSIGSYRPIPDLVWRALWGIGARDQTPFLHHWVNVLLHGVNGALVCVLAFKLLKRRSAAWLAGACFTASAVLTEAVSGVVGIADVLGATGALMALLALSLRLPWMGIAVFLATLFGLYSKESALCCVPLVPVTMLLCAQLLHPGKPSRWLRAGIALVATGAAFVFYVEARRRMFPAPMPAELSADANAGKPFAARLFAGILRWYAQPSLPRDPLNNPLVGAPGPYRVGGALRVYFRGIVQVVFPHTLSGDYSAPQEPVPPSLLSPEIILGCLGMLLPFPIATWLGFSAWRRWRKEHPQTTRAGGTPEIVSGVVLFTCALAFSVVVAIAMRKPAFYAVAAAAFAVSITQLVRGARKPRIQVAPAAERAASDVSDVPGEHPYRDGAPPARPTTGVHLFTVDVRPVVGAGLLWMAVSYFPVSNIPVLLPTVRAERFWYFPVIGTSLLLGLVFAAVLQRWPAGGARKVALGILVAFFGFQAFAARSHANDYTDDLSFWDATRKAVPRSAKAHLNYSVMKGARGDLLTRLDSNKTALELAPQWPMASIYLGDTLCRLHRAQEAWPHYARGFELAPNDVNLIALAIQCLWDEKILAADSPVRPELEALKDKYPGSWIEYLGRDVLEHGEEHNGVDPKYRPRGYNEGPKD